MYNSVKKGPSWSNGDSFEIRQLSSFEYFMENVTFPDEDVLTRSRMTVHLKARAIDRSKLRKGLLKHQTKSNGMKRATLSDRLVRVGK